MNPIVLSIPIFFLLIAFEYGWSLFKNRPTYRSGDFIANVGCGVVEQLSGLFAKVFVVAGYYWVYTHFRLNTMPVNFWTIIGGFIGVDFLYYWAHRMSHEINLFWLGHVVHHQSEDYNLSVALRQGALQKIFTAPFFFPLALVGLDPTTFLLLSAFNTLYQFWIHTEFIGKLGWFEWIFNTPSHHRVHHGRNPEYIDKNHGGTLIIWDRMFNTFEPEKAKPLYGVTLATNTFNPIEAHWVPLAQMGKQLSSLSGWKDKLKLLMMHPGWWPNRSEFPIQSAGIAYKYNPSIPLSLQRYALVQFALILGLSSYALFSFEGNSGLSLSFGVMGLLINLLTLGATFQMKHKWWAEWIRIGTFPLLFYLCGPDLLPIGIATALASGLWYFLLKHS